MPFDLSVIQVVIVLVIALLVFGPAKLPEMARNLGKGIAEFKGAVSGDATAASTPSSRPAPAPAQRATPQGPAVVDSHEAPDRASQDGGRSLDDLVRPGSDQPPTPGA